MSIQPIGTSLPFQNSTASVSGLGSAASVSTKLVSNPLVSGEPAASSAIAARAPSTNPAAQDVARTNGPQEDPSEEALSAAIGSIEAYIKPFNNRLEFSVNDDIDRVVVKVVDKETEDVILQIPSEEMIAIAKALDNIKGLFIKQQA